MEEHIKKVYGDDRNITEVHDTMLLSLKIETEIKLETLIKKYFSDDMFIGRPWEILWVKSLVNAYTCKLTLINQELKRRGL